MDSYELADKKARLKSEFDVDLNSKMEGVSSSMGRDLLDGILESYYYNAREKVFIKITLKDYLLTSKRKSFH